MSETLEKFVERLRNMKIHGPCFAVRDTNGELRSLTDDEKRKLGIDLERARDVSGLIGKEFSIPGTRFKFKLLE